MKLQKWHKKSMVWVLSFSILLSIGFHTPLKAEEGLDIIWLTKEYDEIYFFHEGLVRAVGTNGQMGYIDKTGREAIPFQYEVAMDFNSGLARVRQNEKWGFIDKTGQVVIPFQYDQVYDFREGLAIICKGEKYGFIDKTG